MKKLLLPILLLGFMVSCSTSKPLSAAKYITTTAESKRGDAVICRLIPNDNRGAQQRVNLYAWSQAGGINVCRFLLDFDISKLPAKAKVDSAFIDLYSNMEGLPPEFAKPSERMLELMQAPFEFVVQRVTSDWSELEATWNNQPGMTTKHELVGKKDSDLSKTYHIDVSLLVKDAVKKKKSFYGFMFRLKNETHYKMGLLTASHEYPDKDKHPKLTIYYH